MDGLVTFPGARRDQRTYLQLFRSGAIEAVDAGFIAWAGEDKRIPALALETRLIEATRDYLSLLVSLGITGPVAVALSFLGVRGYKLSMQNVFEPDEPGVLDRDDLVVPDTLVDDLGCDVATMLKSTFDIVWNAFGWPRSLGYDDHGSWTGGRRR